MYTVPSIADFKNYFFRDFAFTNGVASHSIALSAVPASGTFVLNYNGVSSAPINWNDDLLAITANIQANIPALALAVVSGSLASQVLGVQDVGVNGSSYAFTFTSNSLQSAVPAAITLTDTFVPGDYTGVTDADISKAISQARINMNDGLFMDQATFTECFLLLIAHYLCVDLTNSSAGVASTYQWLLSNKGVGSVSAGYSIPQQILDNPLYAMIAKTGYGAKFLSLILPMLIGNMFSVYGGTTP